MFKINSDRTKRLIPTIFKFVGSLVVLTTVLITSFLVSLEIVSSVKYIMMGMVEVELITPHHSMSVNMHERNFPKAKIWIRIPFIMLPGPYNCISSSDCAYWPTNYTKNQSISHSLSRVTKPKVQKSFLKATCQTWFPQQLQKCSLANSKIIAGPPCMRISFKPFSKYLIHTQYFRPIDVTSRFSTNHNKIMGTLS